MALETITGGSNKLAGALSPGEAIEGYLVGAVEELNKFGQKQWNLLMRDEKGAEFKVLTGGNLKYFASNLASGMGKAAVNPNFVEASNQAKDCLNYWVVITRDGSYTQKKTNKEIKTFRIQRDTDRPYKQGTDVASRMEQINF